MLVSSCTTFLACSSLPIVFDTALIDSNPFCIFCIFSEFELNFILFIILEAIRSASILVALLISSGFISFIGISTNSLSEEFSVEGFSSTAGAGAGVASEFSVEGVSSTAASELSVEGVSSTAGVSEFSVEGVSSTAGVASEFSVEGVSSTVESGAGVASELSVEGVSSTAGVSEFSVEVVSSTVGVVSVSSCVSATSG